MSHRLSSALSVFGLLLALAGSAHAQIDGPLPVPADAPVVATTPSGVAVIAWVQGGRTCSTVQRPGQPRPATAGSVTPSAGLDPAAEQAPPLACERTPVLSRYDGGPLGRDAPDGSHVVTWGYAGLGTAAVQDKHDGRVVASAATSPAGLLPAPAADLRFWATDGDPTTSLGTDVALLDDAGVVRRAVAAEDFGMGPGEFSEGGSEPEGTILRRGRMPGATWELRRTVKSVLAPTPLEPERHVRRACLSFVERMPRRLGTSDGPCDDALGAAPMRATTGSSCAVGTRVMVIATAAVRRVVVVTGDGRRRAVPLTTLVAGERAGALVLGMGLAVRQVVALGAGGRVLRTEQIGLAPQRRGTRSCGFASGWYGHSDAARQPRLGAAPHAPRFLDHGVELCSAVDRAPVVPGDCAVPPVAPDLVTVDALRTADGRYLLGIVPAEIAAARITLTDHTTRTLASVPPPGYSGVYAGVVRAIAADVPGPAAVVRVELLDDRGRVLNRNVGTGDPSGPARDVTVLPAFHGAPAVVASSAATYLGTVTCVAFGTSVDAGADPDCLAVLLGREYETGPGSVGVVARCSPRRMLVVAVLAHATDRLTVRTTDGRTLRARMARIRTGARTRGPFFALVTLGPREAPVEARLRGRQAGGVPIGLPPVGRQCGYAKAAGTEDLFAQPAAAGRLG